MTSAYWMILCLGAVGITSRSAAEALTIDYRDALFRVAAWGGDEEKAWQQALQALEALEPTPIVRRQWVVGFLIDDGTPPSLVVLIRKNRPEWQAGFLNGVGGKVEPGEAPADAMRREFREETGISFLLDWEPFARLRWEEGIIHFYRSFAPVPILTACRTVTDESIEVHRIWTLGMPDAGPGDCAPQVTPNLLWLVPLAAHRIDSYDVIDVAETSTTLRKPGRLEFVNPGDA